MEEIDEFLKYVTTSTHKERMYGGAVERWGIKFGQYGVNRTPLGWELYDKGTRQAYVYISPVCDEYFARGPLVRNIEDDGNLNVHHPLILVERQSDVIQDGTTLNRTTFHSKKHYRICLYENQGYEWANVF